MRAPLAPSRVRFWCALWACVLGFGLRLRPPSPLGGVRVCVCSCARPALSPAPPGRVCCAGVRVCARAPLVPCLSWLGCGAWACVLGLGLGCAPPFLVGLSECVFCAFFLGVSWFGFVMSVAGCPCSGPCGPCPPIPFLLGWAAGSFFFFLQRGVCLPVSVSLFPVGRCSWLGVAGFGWVVPLCLFGGPVFRAFWVGGLAASCGVGGRFGGCGLFSRPPSLPPLCFFFLGGACLVPPPPSLGWRTHWPAFSVVFRAAVGGCVLLGRVPAPWVGWPMYTLGLAPLPARLGPGSAGWAAAPGGCVWLWVRGLGLSVSFLLCGAGFNLPGSPPPLLPGARWPRVWPAVPVCGVLVRRLPGCAVACFG